MKTLGFVVLVWATCCSSAVAQTKRFKSRAIMDHLAGVTRPEIDREAAAGPEPSSPSVAKPSRPRPRPVRPPASASAPRDALPAARDAAAPHPPRRVVGPQQVVARRALTSRVAILRPAAGVGTPAEALAYGPPLSVDDGGGWDGGWAWDRSWRWGWDRGSGRGWGFAADASPSGPWGGWGVFAPPPPRRIYDDGMAREGRFFAGTSRRLGSAAYHDLHDAWGGWASGSTTRLGSVAYHDLRTGSGGTMRGTSMRIGQFDYHDFTTSTGESVRGSSQRIGNFIYHDLTDSGGNVLRGTTTILGGQSFTDWSD